jgi:hypothetical protein
MAKRFIPLTLKDYDQNGNEKEIKLTYRLGPKAAETFQSISKIEMTSENIAKLGVKGIVYMIYAGCQAQHHDLKLERVWDLVDNYELDELDTLLAQITPNSEEDTDPNEQ